MKHPYSTLQLSTPSSTIGVPLEYPFEYPLSAPEQLHGSGSGAAWSGRQDDPIVERCRVPVSTARPLLVCECV